MTETTATNGGFLSAKLVGELLVKPLEAASVVLAAAPKIIYSSQPVRIPRITGSTAATAVAEAAVIPEADVATDEIDLLPSTLKGTKQIIRISAELARSSAASGSAVTPAFQERIVTSVVQYLDNQFLLGTGASNTVRGLINVAGANTGVFNAAEPNSLLDGIALAYADEETPTHWFVSGADFIALRKLKDSGGRYLLESDMTKDVTYRLFGLPVVVTNKLATGKVLLVNMNHVVVVVDAAPTVQILTELYAGTDEIGIKVVHRADIGVLHPEAVTVLTASA
jgi:HK97 family phage major capsid protein